MSGEIGTEEEKAIIKQLQFQLDRGRKILSENQGNLHSTRFFLGGVRAELKRIYGTESRIVSLLPAYVPQASKEKKKEILTQVVGSLSCLIEEFSSVGFRAFGGTLGEKVFIGHGRSPLWRELKNFLSERLGLPWDEFNREAVAGITTFERLSTMLEDARFAFLIMTAEDEHTDTTQHARENAVHEVALFQGRLGPRKAIILIEEECEQFSTIVGLSQIRFPRQHIAAIFEEIRRVLEREGIVKP